MKTMNEKESSKVYIFKNSIIQMRPFLIETDTHCCLLCLGKQISKLNYLSCLIV